MAPQGSYCLTYFLDGAVYVCIPRQGGVDGDPEVLRFLDDRKDIIPAFYLKVRGSCCLRMQEEDLGLPFVQNEPP